jgi:membrane protease YdiL (CAAX protease family)
MQGGGEGADHAGAAASAVLLALLAFTVGLVVFSIPAGAYAVFSGRLVSQGQVQACPGTSVAPFTQSTPVCPYLWVGPIPVYLPPFVTAGGYFAFLLAVYTILFLYAGSQRVRPWRAAAESLRGGVGALVSSPFVAIMVSIGFLVFTATVIDGLVSASGVPIGSISGQPLAVFVGLATAPLVEELGFRVVLIGLVALVLSAGRPWRDFLGALWRPSRATEGLGPRSFATVAIWGATGVSSVVFGVAHVAYGGWAVGKLPEAAFGGAVLGYVYVKYGFHAAVLTHFGVDYFGSALAFFGQAAYGIPWNSATTEYFGQYLVDYNFLYLFGLASFLYVAYIGVRRLVGAGPADAEPYNPPLAGGAAEA